MEDAHIAMGSMNQGPMSSSGLFAVFDGHGGKHIADFCAESLPRALAESGTAEPAHALHSAFLRMDEVLIEAAARMPLGSIGHPDRVGCTAVACLVEEKRICVANAGDSRAVLCRNGKAVECSQDHKPSLQSEAARIQRAGGFITEQSCAANTVHRINGDLSLSRAIGDLRFKKNASLAAEEQMVSCVPEVRTFSRHPDDEFMVLACDGIWDVLDSQEVVDRVAAHLPALHRAEVMPADVVCKILDECLASDPSKTGGIGGDNMTMVLVVFRDAEVPCKQPAVQQLAVRHPVLLGHIEARTTSEDSDSLATPHCGSYVASKGRRDLMCEDDGAAATVFDEIAAAYKAGSNAISKWLPFASPS